MNLSQKPNPVNSCLVALNIDLKIDISHKISWVKKGYIKSCDWKSNLLCLIIRSHAKYHYIYPKIGNYYRVILKEKKNKNKHLLKMKEKKKSEIYK